MLKKLLAAVAVLVASIGFAFAQVDVNKADQAALDGVKGIGPSISKKIIDERAKGGNFKDWMDFETRVKGVGAKNAAKMSAAGLTVNNQPLAGSPATAAAPAKGKKEAKAATSTSVAPTAAATATAAAPAAPAAPAASAATKASAAANAPTATATPASATAPTKK